MVRLKEHAFSCVHGRQRQFQFHYGTIKRSISPTDTEVFPEFQFHYGTIKRTRNSFVASKAMIFQFHYGTIKRRMQGGCVAGDTYFNSTMVRLKDQ